MHCFASTLRLTKSLSVRTKITRIPHLGCNVQKCFRVWQVELLIKLQSITTNMISIQPPKWDQEMKSVLYSLLSSSDWYLSAGHQTRGEWS